MEDLAKSVAKLKRQSKAQSTGLNSCKNAGDTIDVDYFALQDLLRFFDETQEAARRVLIAREALSGDMFSGDGGVFRGMRSKPYRPRKSTRKAC